MSSHSKLIMDVVKFSHKRKFLPNKGSPLPTSIFKLRFCDDILELCLANKFVKFAVDLISVTQNTFFSRIRLK